MFHVLDVQERQKSDLEHLSDQRITVRISMFERVKYVFTKSIKLKIIDSSSHTRTQKEGSRERPKDKPPREYKDFSCRPQGAPTTASPRYVFEAF